MGFKVRVRFALEREGVAQTSLGGRVVSGSLHCDFPLRNPKILPLGARRRARPASG